MESQPDSNTIQSFNVSNGGGMQDLVIGIIADCKNFSLKRFHLVRQSDIHHISCNSFAIFELIHEGVLFGVFKTG
jgi:hypothetical protein